MSAFFEYRKENNALWYRYNFLKKGSYSLPEIIQIVNTELHAVEIRFGDLHFYRDDSGHWHHGKMRN